MMKNYQLYLFDFDYPLADSSAGIVKCFQITLEKSGLPAVEKDTICRTVGLPMREALLGTVLDGVRRHAAGVEQADDCTQLAIRYRGEPDVVSWNYSPTMEDLAKATSDLEGALATVPDRVRNQMLVAADEIFANIVRHSGATKWSLTVEKTRYPDRVRLVTTDDGKAFDPLSIRDPDTMLCAEERAIGGLGILIVKKTMSPVTYRRRNGKNVLSMGKDYGD